MLKHIKQRFILMSTRSETRSAVCTKEQTIHPVKLRLEANLLNQIDAVVTRRRPAPSRHQWILEAIFEKLKREQ